MARRPDGRVELAVRDTGAGLRERAPAGQGVGLANIRERLALLHGEGASLELAPNAPQGCIARITLPASTPEAAPAASSPQALHGPAPLH
jgi:signal transduction histidine kinase